MTARQPIYSDGIYSYFELPEPEPLGSDESHGFLWNDGSERVADAIAASREAINRVRLMKAVACQAKQMPRPYHFPYHARTCAEWVKP